VFVTVGNGVLVAVGKAVNVAVGGTFVLVAVGGKGVNVYVGVGETGVFVTVAVGDGVVVEFPPPKSSSRALLALTNHKPICPPLGA